MEEIVKGGAREGMEWEMLEKNDGTETDESRSREKKEKTGKTKKMANSQKGNVISLSKRERERKCK